MNDERDEIRARIDIVELVGASVRLQKKGKSFKGLCPFHADRNPSFEVSPQTGRYTCWSCGEKGDIFTWVMKTQNVEFPEALRTLAKMAGVTLRERQGAGDASQRENLRAAMAEAQSFFREQLPRSPEAMAYCARRGLSDDVLEQWGLGYAPEGGEALTARLKRKGFALSDCKTAFLVDQDASGGFYDKFRGRLMFPIWNEKGELIAFGGRILAQGEPKYINSSDTPLFSKSRVLYGMNFARAELQKSHRAVLVEGYLDVIACHRAGLTSALASLGTAFTPEHAKLLRRWVEEVVILYDSDSAGQNAAAKAAPILAAEGLKVRVALMPEGEDPDTLLATRGPEAVRESVEHGLSPMEYRLQALERKYPDKGDDFWLEVLPILADATTNLELEKHAFRLAGQYPGIRDVSRAERALLRDVARFRSSRNDPSGPDRSTAAVPGPKAMPIRKRLRGSEIAIFLGFLNESLRPKVWIFARHRKLFLNDPAIHLSASLGEEFGEEAPAGPPAHWLHRLPEEDQATIEELLTLDDPVSEDVITDAVRQLERDQRQRLLSNSLGEEMTPAERNEKLRILREIKPDKNQRSPGDRLF